MTMIKPSDLKARWENEDLLVIDVREAWEYDEENIGAKNIPLAELPNCLDELDCYKNAEIIVHCQSGRRSHQARKYLTKQGFCHVKSLEGGIEAYLNL